MKHYINPYSIIYFLINISRMIDKCSILLIALIIISLTGNTIYAQVETESDTTGFVIDTLMKAETVDSLASEIGMKVRFTTEQAIKYISEWYEKDIWNSEDDPLRKSIRRLLFEVTNDPLYISRDYIRQYEWEKIKIPASSFYMWDTIHIPVPSVRDKKINRMQDMDIYDPLMAQSKLDAKEPEHLQEKTDTILALGDSINIVNPADLNNIFVQTDIQRSRQNVSSEHDSIIIVISDTLKEVISSNPDFPFLYYDYPMIGDSIQSAVKKIVGCIEENDSSRVIITGSRSSVPVWLSNNSSRMTRLWLENEWGQAVSVWIGSKSRDSIDIIVERGVHFRRPGKTYNIADAKVNLKTIDNSKLAEARKIEVKPQYWKFLSEASFVFNQAMIKNWVKGGESNITTVLDITGTASYTNKKKKIVWDNQGRLKFGLITSAGSGISKNIDHIDIVSKFNNNAFGKFDFSATMLFKTQLAYGYNYPNDSVVVSKFFNPASLTLGLGLDYKPNGHTSINFAPLSYKGTYVPDTVMIDQTKHGLLADQRSRHEPGMSAQISHKTKIFDEV
ncbi:MAG TPA: hypothetical protein DEQ09_10060, partial [Bacteroidales bacterium]|nr:hypothetical protein [Bacteroidales bacterium]